MKKDKALINFELTEDNNIQWYFEDNKDLIIDDYNFAILSMLDKYNPKEVEIFPENKLDSIVYWLYCSYYRQDIEYTIYNRIFEVILIENKLKENGIDYEFNNVTCI